MSGSYIHTSPSPTNAEQGFTINNFYTRFLQSKWYFCWATACLVLCQNVNSQNTMCWSEILKFCFLVFLVIYTILTWHIKEIHAKGRRTANSQHLFHGWAKCQFSDSDGRGALVKCELWLRKMSLWMNRKKIKCAIYFTGSIGQGCN